MVWYIIGGAVLWIAIVLVMARFVEGDNGVQVPSVYDNHQATPDWWWATWWWWN